MRYNLFKKETASDWEAAKKKLLKSTSLNEERIAGDYKEAFPYIYKEEEHFVFEGELAGPYKIVEDLSIYFYTDKECIELGYRTLGIGEVLEEEKIVYIPSPGQYYKWEQGKWVYDADLERVSLNSKIQAVERELEVIQAQIVSRKALGMYTEALEAKSAELLKKHSDLCYDLSLIEGEKNGL